ncbi:MAG: PIN domain-containing protein [Acidobacteria bacterium]|nr:PIN domain-containing protein [Acidobacteriota bacterium]MCI0717759.1 PIN domain-containing protein [Acidobacteriota bacterium]
MTGSNSILIYLDTNVYSRPFDDQTQADIQEEANAFLEIMAEIKAGKLTLLGSDILDFEAHNILSEEKRAKIKDSLELCDKHLESSEEVRNLAKRIQNDCHIRARDALHIASAIKGQARYFLSCDKKVTQMKQARCYRRLTKPHRSEYFSAMNPILFVEKIRKGEIE